MVLSQFSLEDFWDMMRAWKWEAPEAVNGEILAFLGETRG
jgi:hypothetical protein